jgi:hypothetical protein
MDDKDKKPNANEIVQICATLGGVIGFSVFQGIAPSLFSSSPGSGINYTRVMWAGVAGGGATLVGGGIGLIIKKSRK